MAQRTAEDRLREEYFALLPQIRRVAEELEAEVRHCLLSVSRRLERHERVVVTSRVKECESAVDKLRSREEGGDFDPSRVDLYSLRELNDLAGVRVSVFPRSRCDEISQEIHKRFPSFEADSAYGSDQNNGFKYHGVSRASHVVRGEIQVVPMLTALFWAVEHDAIYKPSPRLKGVAGSLSVRLRTEEVLQALKAFEDEFEKVVQNNPLK